ncbi:MAG: hypothetical protein KDB14_30805 [Planctomycetales bacterium]|nr:hypothetical protein [Planctomycetales bacterium]
MEVRHCDLSELEGLPDALEWLLVTTNHGLGGAIVAPSSLHKLELRGIQLSMVDLGCAAQLEEIRAIECRGVLCLSNLPSDNRLKSVQLSKADAVEVQGAELHDACEALRLDNIKGMRMDE